MFDTYLAKQQLKDSNWFNYATASIDLEANFIIFSLQGSSYRSIQKATFHIAKELTGFNHQLLIHSMSGQLWVACNQVFEEMHVDVQNLPKGVYQLSFIGELGVMSRRLIIQ